jgi:hypothetical protein
MVRVSWLLRAVVLIQRRSWRFVLDYQRMGVLR